jgi:hypothetical protein
MCSEIPNDGIIRTWFHVYANPCTSVKALPVVRPCFTTFLNSVYYLSLDFWTLSVTLVIWTGHSILESEYVSVLSWTDKSRLSEQLISNWTAGAQFFLMESAVWVIHTHKTFRPILSPEMKTCAFLNTFCLEDDGRKRPQTMNIKHQIPILESFKNGSQNTIKEICT